jgi:TctA family transporter
MLEAILSGLASLLSPIPFAMLLVGVGVGLATGLLPGLGTTTAFALLLPFLFTMTPVAAFSLLMGILAVDTTVSAITAILYAIPTAAGSAATVADGYAMTQRGEAARAIGAGIFSSALGGIFAAIVLGVSVPLLRPLILSFGSPEQLMIVLVGIAFISSLGGRSPVKGWLSGGLGLLLATVGLDLQTSTERFTLGSLYLWNGLPILPVLIGIFAIPEIVDLAVRGTSLAVADKIALGKAGVWEGFKDSLRHWKVTVRSSLIGTIFGIIPGLGPGAASFVAYGDAVQSSKEPERFGKGAPEGVIAAETANNAASEAGLIPTLAFGVPGTIAMAVFLGALTIHGVTPGIDLLTQKTEVIYSMMWALLIANVIGAAISLALANPLARVTFIRGSLIIPFLLVLVFIGSFAANNSLSDIVTLIAFGLFGHVMKASDWPRIPLVLGLILGKQAEKYFTISFTNWGLGFLSRPAVIAMLVLSFFVSLYPLLRRKGRGSGDDS